MSKEERVSSSCKGNFAVRSHDSLRFDSTGVKKFTAVNQFDGLCFNSFLKLCLNLIQYYKSYYTAFLCGLFMLIPFARCNCTCKCKEKTQIQQGSCTTSWTLARYTHKIHGAPLRARAGRSGAIHAGYLYTTPNLAC